MLVQGLHHLRSSEGMVSSLIRCSVISGLLRIGSRLKLMMPISKKEKQKKRKKKDKQIEFFFLRSFCYNQAKNDVFNPSKRMIMCI